MDMLLMGVCVCLFAMAVVAVAFRAVTRSEPSISTGQPSLESTKAVEPDRLFTDGALKQPVLPPQQIPIELLLLQIENHVRLEQAAAESFLEFPTRALLHSKTTSPFVN
jgi:hypothetical protein